MRHSGFAVIGTALTLALATGCSNSNADPDGGSATTGSRQTPGQSATTPAAAPAASAGPAAARTIPLNIQGVAPVGVTVRVKSIELGTDATILDVSASYGGTFTADVNLAGSDTYLLDDAGNRLMLKPPQDNERLRVRKGETMEGKLVFLGTLPANATAAKLVFNDNNAGDSSIDPGLTITIPLAQK